MTIATWILAVAILALAAEGGTTLLQRTNRLPVGRTRREMRNLPRVSRAAAQHDAQA